MLQEQFITGALIEKLLASWKHYKNNLKQKRKEMSLQELVVHIRIGENNMEKERVDALSDMSLKANLIEDKACKKHERIEGKSGDQNKKFKKNFNPNYKKKGACHKCRKQGHWAPQCNGNNDKNSISLVESNVIAVVVVLEVNMVANSKKWILDTKATRHLQQQKLFPILYSH
uniref:CCHC-type domain-containing protein n=1 Tax=Nelumbo nucifera TaxID=4432 RepID=A0A822ZIW2_NELNU|nr:TPA_asm: hypothetical protein HUJ06_001539 [Nelumbo nucifera]